MKKEYSAFANHFTSTFAPEIFKMYLAQVELYISNQAWLSKKCLNLVFSYFGSWCVPTSVYLS